MLKQRKPMARGSGFKRPTYHSISAPVTRGTGGGVMVSCAAMSPALKKSPSSFNQVFRDLAQGEECTAKIPDVCRCHPDTTVLAHSNRLQDGKGRGYKSHDHLGAFIGHDCHVWLDQGRALQEEKDAAFAIAQQRTRERLYEIVNSPAARPWKVKAAQWALDRLAIDEL